MENFIEYFFGGILTLSSVVLFVSRQFATEVMTDLIKRIFKTKTKKETNRAFYATAVILLIVGIGIIIITNKNSSVREIQEVSTTKSDAELIVDGLEIIVDETTKSIERTKQQNAEIIKNRAKKFVYQIGYAKDNRQSVLQLYKSIQENTEIDISRISVFKISRKKYFLYLDNAYSETQVSDSLSVTKATFSGITSNITIVDLTKYCRAKEEIEHTKPVTSRKFDFGVPCYECE